MASEPRTYFLKMGTAIACELIKNREKMYKVQFKKWGWRKYQGKVPIEDDGAPGSSFPPKAHRSCIRRIRPGSTCLPIDTSVCHLDDVSSQNETIATVTRRFLLNAAECDPMWKRTSRFQLLSPSDLGISADWYTALDALDEDPDLGWPMIRRRFLDLERLVETVSLPSLLGSCFHIPRSLLFSNHKDILPIYLSHLEQLSRRKNPGHPVQLIATALRSIAEIGGHDDMRTVLVLAANVWADTLTQTRGLLDRSGLMAAWDLIRVSDLAKDTAVTARWCSDWEELYDLAILTHGKQSFGAIFLESDLECLLERAWVYPDGIDPSLEKVIDPWRKKVHAAYGDGSSGLDIQSDFFTIGPAVPSGQQVSSVKKGARQ